MSNNQFHNDFKINGRSFSSVAHLLTYSKVLSVPIHNFLQDWFSKKKVVEVKTSGSTGTPKIIQLQKEFMKNSAKATGQFFELSKNTTALLCMPTEYIAGKMMLVRALELGWHLDIVKPSSNPLQNVNKVYDFSAMVPMQLQDSLDNIEKVKKLIVGGGVVSKELEKQMQFISTEVFATYGMTETITHIAVKRLNHFNNNTSSGVENSLYAVLPDITISSDDRNCLVINAPRVSDIEIVTNDVIEMISETEFKWLGRFDNVINSGGVKLHPEEIEKKLFEKISQRFFVAGVTDILLGEKLILIIEGKATTISLDKFEHLSKYEIPKETYFLEKFVETATGKVQRDKTINLL